MERMVDVQVEHLSSVRETRNLLVSIVQPVTVLISSILPSPESLEKESKSVLEMGSFLSVGRPRICMARGTTLAALFALLGVYNATGIMSSM